ncbi:hypothetical protein [Kineococcus gypseus]|uniref:hypothetical protein n=1 Tax=Kineococcus gypseus TaxID=1637102 RepID=UPI003D7D6BBD
MRPRRRARRRPPAFALVAVPVLLLLAGSVLVRTPAGTVQDAVVTAAGASVCARTAGAVQPVCFDARHVEHLGLGGVRVGDCLRTTRTGTALVAEAFTRAVPADGCRAA